MASSVALVTPWFGPDLSGGAEILARQVALGLAERGHPVEVLTTCCRAFNADWGVNFHQPGPDNDGPLLVRRFAVDHRAAEAFDRANARLLAQPAERVARSTALLNGETAATFVRENINSRTLQEHLAAHLDDFRAVLFLPYLYGPILHGVPIAGGKAFLQPLLHEEAYAFLPQVETIVHGARGLLLSSEGELQLAKRLYGPGIAGKSTIVGHWIDPPPNAPADAQRIGSLDPARDRYVLYLGRRDDTKNVGLLVEAFRKYRRKDRVVDLKLVLAGPGPTSFDDPDDGIVDLGFVSDTHKYDLLRGALALCQPSYNESFSRSMMEAWSCGRPVAVHAYCLSTATAVERSRGGWTAATKDEWTRAFQTIDHAGRSALAAAGARGRDYYLQHATRESVIARYETALGLNERGAPSSNGTAAHCFVHAGYVPNACSDTMRLAYALETGLRQMGEGSAGGPRVLVVHGTQPDVLRDALTHAGPLALTLTIDDVEELEHADVRAVLERANAIITTDERMRTAIRAFTQRDVDVIGLVAAPEIWDVTADARLVANLQDERNNIVFAGPLDALSWCDDLVTAFSFLLAMRCDARLTLVDGGPPSDYSRKIQEMIDRHGLGDRVAIATGATLAQIAAYYRTASLFWSLSSSDRGSANLLDALWFEIPIVAHATQHVRELLGPAGLLVTDAQDGPRLGALAKTLLHDADLRSRVLRAQRSRRDALEPRIPRSDLRRFVERVTASKEPVS